MAPISRPRFALALAGSLLLSACGSGDQAPPQMPPPQVTVVTLKAAPVSLTRELAGRTVPYLVAEVRPQATGIVKRRLFEEGSLVKQGDALYEIDAASYRAAADSARAALARAEANATSTRLAAERSARLVQSKLVSAQDNESVQATALAAQAEVAAARAELRAAQVNLGYTRIVAPIGGRIGKSSVTAGALVTANQEAALATVQKLDPIYVDLSQSSSEWLALRRQIEEGRLQRADGVPVKILLEDGTPYAHDGRLAFADVTVDPGTGSYALRVVVPNPDNLLLPGMYLRAVVDMGQRPDGVLAPQKGISRDPKGNATAMVVLADGTVEARTVVASRTLGDQWLVESGLEAGDRVIVEGLQKVQPGAKAQAEEQGAAPAPQDAPAAADAAE
jgi:membrane fusion protein (multidrug efflux system)